MKPNANNAKYAILFIWIVLILGIAASISIYMQYNLLSTIQSGHHITLAAAKANDSRQSIISILTLIAYIVSAVFFLRWFKTAYHNLGQKTDLRRTSGWAIGSWFIPLGNLFIPYEIMKELYVETREYLEGKNCEVIAPLKTRYVGWWWALWITCSVVGYATAMPLIIETKGIEKVILATQISMAFHIIRIPLCLITIKVIKDYARIEPLLQQIDNQPPHAHPDQPPPLPTPA